MLRWIVIAVVVVGLTAAATFVIQSEPTSVTNESHAVNERKGPQPKVEIDEGLLHEFGAMSQESKGSHGWEVKNVGEGVLELWLEGKTTCSCTLANLKEKVAVQPRDSFKITLDWESKHFNGDYSQGATIGTNDPRRPTFTLTVKGKIFPPVIVYPPEMVQFNGISNEEVARRPIFVMSKDRPKMKIKNLSTSSALIVATQEPMTEQEQVSLDAKGGCRVNLEIKPGMPLGAFHEELIIETDHPLRPLVKVSITGKTTGPISVVPERVRIPSVTSAQGAAQDLSLLVRGGRATTFEVVRQPTGLKIAITPNDTPTQKARYRLRVTVPPGTPAHAIEDDIVLKTDHPRASELKIPVTILISNAAPG